MLTTMLNPSLHKPAQQAGAAQVINAPPNGPPQGSYHIVELSTTWTSNLPPFPQHLVQSTAHSKNTILYTIL